MERFGVHFGVYKNGVFNEQLFPFDSITRGVPNFDLDMNRIFPGSPDGSLAEIAARAIIDDLSGADMVIDLHSSNIFLREVPQARINVDCSDSLLDHARLLNL